jgi:glutamine amidotransferase
MGGSTQTVVAHNGILGRQAWPGKGDDRSDTRIFADELLPTYYKRLDRKGVQKALTQWLGSNKILVLTTDPRYNDNAYLFNERLGTWDKETGVWHSNNDFRGYDYYRAKTTSTTALAGKSAEESAETFQKDVECHIIGKPSLPRGKHSDDYMDVCYVCSIGDVDRNGYCDSHLCRACQDCYVHIRECQCYVRASQAMEDAGGYVWDDDQFVYYGNDGK